MSRQVLAGLGLALAIASLVVAASFIGAGGGDRTGRAEARLRALYERGDASAVLDRLVPGSFGTEEPGREQLEQALGQVLDEGLTVTDSSTVEVHGVQLVRIATPRVVWCVTPDDRLLLGCRVATGEVETTVDGPPIEVAFSSFDVLADRAELALVLTTSGDQPVSIGQPDIPQPYELSQVSYVAGGQQAPAPAGDLDVQPGLGLLMLLTATDVESAGDEPIVMEFDGGTIEVQITRISWTVGEEAA